MAMTFGTGSLAVVTLGVATTLLISERPGHGTAAPRQDMVAPEVPSGLIASLPEEGQVSLSWSANWSDPDLVGYVVYRSDRPEGGFRCITDEPVRTNAFVDGDAPQGRECFYRVAARDASRNESALSPGVSVRTLADATAPDEHATALNAGF